MEENKHIGQLIELPKIEDRRGNLTVADGLHHLPFAIARTYWVYDVPGGKGRGGHAHRQCMEALVAISGSFHVRLDDGRHTETYLLNHPWEALVIPTGVWRTLDDFSSGAVCLVMASHPYEEADYIRTYKAFKTYINRKK